MFILIASVNIEIGDKGEVIEGVIEKEEFKSPPGALIWHT